MLDTILQINIMPLSIFVTQLLTMGLPVIDENLESLLDAMANSPLQLGTFLGLARIIGSSLALCAGAYESWVMILGRRGLDVLKLLRIVGIAICINVSPTICSIAKAPGLALESEMRAHAMAKNQDVASLEIAVAKKQGEYLAELHKKDSIETAKKFAADMAKADGMIDKVGVHFDHVLNQVGDWAKENAILFETKACELLNDVIRFIGEVLFQMMYYGMLVAQRCFMAILGMFCPVAFAMSLAPPFKSAWSQWLGKYISLSLWGFVVYCVLYYTEFFMIIFLNQDLTAYTQLMGGIGEGSITALGAQSIGTTIAYVVSMFIGCKILSMVPEVASWLIPGGVSSGAGGAAMGAAGMVFGYAAGAASATVKESRDVISTISHGGSAGEHYANSQKPNSNKSNSNK